MKYIVYKQFNNIAICGEVNIPQGADCECENKIITYQNKQICVNTSENAHTYFMRNDDNQGMLRGQLIEDITTILSNNKDKWDIIMEDTICQAYRRSEHDDNWLWNHAFYNTSIDVLQYIKSLIDEV